MIYVFSNNDRHPVTETFTALHFFSFKIHPATLHYPLICFNPISIPYRSTSPHFTTLHLTSPHFTPHHHTSPHISTLHPTSPHFTSHHHTSPHITTLHLTSLHRTFRLFSPHLYSFPFTPFITPFLTLFLKMLGLQGKLPNASAASWFQFLMVLFTKEYFPISDLCFLSLIFPTWSTLLKQ